MPNALCLVADLLAPAVLALEPQRVASLGGPSHDLDLRPGERQPLAAEVHWRDGRPIVRDLSGRGFVCRGQRHREIMLAAGDLVTLDLRSPRDASVMNRTTRLRLLVARRIEAPRLAATELPAIEWQRIVTASRPGYQQLFDVAMAASASAPVWIRGESGTGKELAAFAIHAAGPRSHAAFEAINCAALPENLIESELFGVERGAFTGAMKSRAGAFARAHGGTLFLDEVGELPMGAQAKLLRALESGEIRPIGGDRVIKVDVRVVCASWRDLEVQVAQGRFRHDLLHRLWVLRVDLPPLRDRPDDLLPILDGLLRGDGQTSRDDESGLWPNAGLLARLKAQAWPGNIRELKNCAQRALATCEVLDLLPPSASSPRVTASRLGRTKTETITNTLEQFRGNRSRSARALGVSRSTFYRWITEAAFAPGKQPPSRAVYDH